MPRSILAKERACESVLSIQTSGKVLELTFSAPASHSFDVGGQRSGYSSLVRIDETKTAGLTFNQIDRDEVLTAVHRRKAGCGFFPGIVVFSRHLLSGLIINTYRNLFRWFGGASREPVLISSIEIHRDEGMIVRLNGPAPMAISDLETVI